MVKKPQDRYFSSLLETCRKWPEYHVCSELRLKAELRLKDGR